MTIPQQAIEAGAKSLLHHGTVIGDMRQARGDWDAAGHDVQQDFLAMSTAVLTSAQPHFEADLRAKISAEIREAPRIYDARMTQDPAS